MTKILVNKKIEGKFSLSLLSVMWLAKNNHPIAIAELREYEEFGKKQWYGNGHTHKFDGYKRDDPLLLECFEKLQKAMSGIKSELKIIEIPDDIDWCIQANMGYEWVAEKHKTWD